MSKQNCKTPNFAGNSYETESLVRESLMSVTSFSHLSNSFPTETKSSEENTTSVVVCTMLQKISKCEVKA